MFGVGFGEFVIIVVVALIVIGPEKLPEVAKAIAKAYNELRRATTDIKRSVRDIDLKDAIAGERPRKDSSAPPASPGTPEGEKEESPDDKGKAS